MDNVPGLTLSYIEGSCFLDVIFGGGGGHGTAFIGNSGDCDINSGVSFSLIESMSVINAHSSGAGSDFTPGKNTLINVLVCAHI